MEVHYCFIVILVILNSLCATVTSNPTTTDQIINTDTKIALIEKDVEYIKSVLNALLKQAQSTAKLSKQIAELQQQAALWKNTDAKQQAMETTLANEIQEVSNIDSRLYQLEGLSQHQYGINITNSEECGCKEELRRLNSTGVTMYSDMLTKQTVFVNQVIRQVERLNQPGKQCGCQNELDLLNVTLTKKIEQWTASSFKNATNSSLIAIDCAELKQSGTSQSGVYTVSPKDNQGKFDVYCDMETDGGGWTVFQRRHDGSVDFNQTWDSYKKGFGQLNGEFWTGNENVHRLTTVNNYTLRIDLKDWSGVKVYAKYPKFIIGNEVDKYRITFGNYSGDAGDSLSYNKGQQFTTKDQDNDGRSTGNCANIYGGNGGWWYKSCHLANLNGLYYQGGIYSSSFGRPNGARWNGFHTGLYSLKHTEMKIRPSTFKP